MKVIAELNKPCNVQQWWKFIFEYKYIQNLKIKETKEKIMAYED